MKAIMLAGMLIIAASCTGTAFQAEREYVFSLESGGTKATDIVPGQETGIDHWSVILFDSNNPSVHYSASTGGGQPITCCVKGGRNYIVFAQVNFPTSGPGAFDASYIDNADDLASHSLPLSANALGAMMMWGDGYLGAGEGDVRQQIPVSRLVSKVAIDEIKLDFSEPSFLTGKTFTLERIYLTNVLLQSFAGNDLMPGEVPDDESLWYNAMGYHGSGTVDALDALVSGDRIGRTLPNGSSYTTRNCFYTFPNPLSVDDDVRDLQWRARCTRLVIETSLSGKNYYYTITLPLMERNNSYTITKATIRNLGSTNPEEEIPGAVDAEFSAAAGSWDRINMVQELS